MSRKKQFRCLPDVLQATTEDEEPSMSPKDQIDLYLKDMLDEFSISCEHFFPADSCFGFLRVSFDSRCKTDEAGSNAVYVLPLHFLKYYFEGRRRPARQQSIDLSKHVCHQWT